MLGLVPPILSFCASTLELHSTIYMPCIELVGKLSGSILLRVFSGDQLSFYRKLTRSFFFFGGGGYYVKVVGHTKNLRWK